MHRVVGVALDGEVAGHQGVALLGEVVDQDRPGRGPRGADALVADARQRPGELRPAAGRHRTASPQGSADLGQQLR